MECIFCGIVSGSLPADIIVEGDTIRAFLDIDPITEGHLLVVPVRHVVELAELSASEWAALKPVIDRLVGGLHTALGVDGVSIMQNGGRFNDVGHLHWHLIPRKVGDGFGWLPGKASPSKTALKKGAEKIKAALR